MFVCALVDVEKKLGFDILPLFLMTRVTSLCMSPVDDTFISGSLDKTIRLWDLRSPNCQVCVCLCCSLVILCDFTGIGKIKQPVVSET